MIWIRSHIICKMVFPGVVLGSAALENPQLVKKAVEQYGSRVAVGIDAKNGMVSARGWLSDSQTDYLSLAEKMDLAGSGWIVFTDISKDGMMEGPNLSQLSQLRKRVSCRLTAAAAFARWKISKRWMPPTSKRLSWERRCIPVQSI